MATRGETPVVLLQGNCGDVAAWNEWRKQEPEVVPDLENVSLRGLDLKRVNLHSARLRAADLRDCDLTGADLRETDGLASEQMSGAILCDTLLPDPISEFELLDHVEDLANASRALFFTILLACIFACLSIGSTSDVEMLTNSATSELPVIGANVRIIGFFYLAPLILLAMFLWLCLYLQRLWESLAALPAVFPDGSRLDQRSHPWLFTGLPTLYFAQLREHRPRFAGVQCVAVFLLAYGVVPATLIAVWQRCVCRHDLGLTVVHVLVTTTAACLSVTFAMMIPETFNRQPRQSLQRNRGNLGIAERSANPTMLTRVIVVSDLMLLLTASISALAFSATWPADRSALDEALSDWATISVNEIRISEAPQDWKYSNDSSLRVVKSPVLRNRNLRGLRARGAFLVGAKFQGSDVAGAILSGARLEGAVLTGAVLRGADLSGADLSGSILDGCVLDGADLSNTTLSRASIKDATFTNATLTGADLSTVDNCRAAQFGDALGWRFADLPPDVGNALSLSEPPESAGAFMSSVVGEPASKERICLHFVDVGQGDCTFIECPGGKTILVDCGTMSSDDETARRVNEYISSRLAPNDPRIDTLVITHTHSDSFNLLPSVLGDIKIEEIVMGAEDSWQQDASGGLLARWIADKASTTKLVRLGTNDYSLPDSAGSSPIDAGEAEVFVLAANIEGRRNDRSIVLKVQFNEFDAILSGDATYEVERTILDRYEHDWLDVELLKLALGGSGTSSNSMVWFAATRPEIAVISTGFNNPFGHPRLEVIERVVPYTFSTEPHAMQWAESARQFTRIEDFREAIYSTATNGTIVVRSDGEKYSIEYENPRNDWDAN